MIHELPLTPRHTIPLDEGSTSSSSYHGIHGPCTKQREQEAEGGHHASGEHPKNDAIDSRTETNLLMVSTGDLTRSNIDKVTSLFSSLGFRNYEHFLFAAAHYAARPTLFLTRVVLLGQLPSCLSLHGMTTFPLCCMLLLLQGYCSRPTLTWVKGEAEQLFLPCIIAAART